MAQKDSYLLSCNRMKNVLFFGILLFLLVPTHARAAETIIHLGDEILSIPHGNEVSGVSIIAADLGDDDIQELIIGAGLGSEPRVYVLRQDGSEIGNFLAYAPTLGVGINVTACDLTGDGYPEIITAPQRGGGPHIRIFDRYGNAIDEDGFFAYAQTMRNGVHLTCGDLTGDGRAELVTLPAAGSGTHVRTWNMIDNHMTLVENFFAFDSTQQTGLVGTVHNKQLIVTQEQSHTTTIKTFEGSTLVNEQTHNIDTVGIASLVVMNDELIITTHKEKNLVNLTTDETKKLSTVSLATSLKKITPENSSEEVLVTSPTRNALTSTTESKTILVDTNTQRLFAYEHGILANSFLISSGKHDSTPIGSFAILAKIPEVHYAWNYGEGNPNNYDLGWIPYNLRFYPHIYIHYAPWHNNFGTKMSHGCVNVSLENMQWLYDWSHEGIPIEVK